MSFSFLFILTAGMVAAFNPCGIALLPSYISYLIGGETKDHSFRYAIFKGLGLGGAMTTGVFNDFCIGWFVDRRIGKRTNRDFSDSFIGYGYTHCFIGVGHAIWEAFAD